MGAPADALACPTSVSMCASMLWGTTVIVFLAPRKPCSWHQADHACASRSVATRHWHRMLRLPGNIYEWRAKVKQADEATVASRHWQLHCGGQAHLHLRMLSCTDAIRQPPTTTYVYIESALTSPAGSFAHIVRSVQQTSAALQCRHCMHFMRLQRMHQHPCGWPLRQCPAAQAAPARCAPPPSLTRPARHALPHPSKMPPTSRNSS